MATSRDNDGMDDILYDSRCIITIIHGISHLRNSINVLATSLYDIVQPWVCQYLESGLGHAMGL